jgi:hypothetical protein
LGFFDEYIDFYYHSYHDIISNSSFFRPKLRLEFDEHKKQNDYAPSGTAHGNTQRYLRVYVENEGYRSVHNCQAEMAVVIPGDANGMFYPSDEWKLLAWGRFPQSNDLTDKRTIRGHGKELLHIVFSDSLFDGVHTNKEEEKRLAGISSIHTLTSITSDIWADGQTYLKPQDGFPIGEFELELSITSDEGSYVQAKLRILVERDFQKLRIKNVHSRRKLKII